MPHRAPRNALAFKRRLLKWFRSHGRDLPWRRTRDPYRVLVSEIMLQQTQVSRVTEYYRHFLNRFPTIERLASARPRQVREAWAGLGYYRRADNLHRLARHVVAEHDSSLPSDPAALVKLPGIGRYTAGAVANFAYGKRKVAVDTNVARVLRRAFRDGRASAGSKGAPPDRATWALAERLLPSRPQTAWEFNQALMDLGARYCTARSPKCPTCPVRPACRTGRLPRTSRSAS
ncbi:MAG: A/G-specific adenine glycosylase [Gemmatimonadales bacterium]|jgi:A/G-specific adenine glycosylase